MTPESAALRSLFFGQVSVAAIVRFTKINLPNFEWYLIKVGVVDVDIRISSHLKEELAWAVDKQLRIISTIMLFKKQ